MVLLSANLDSNYLFTYMQYPFERMANKMNVITRTTSSDTMLSKLMFVDREVIFRLGSRSLRREAGSKGRPSYRGIQTDGLSLTIDARTVAMAVAEGKMEVGGYYKAMASGNEANRTNGKVVNVSELFDVTPITAAEFETLKPAEPTIIKYERQGSNLASDAGSEAGPEGVPSLDE